MYNWSVDEKRFKKEHPEEYELWKLTQLINYGLGHEKLDKQKLIKAWPKIADRLDPDRRKAIEFFIWGKKWTMEPGLRPNRSNFWEWYFKKVTS